MQCNNYIYIYHLNKYWYIPVSPDDVSDSMSSTFAETSALSRSAPVFTYSRSGPRTVSVNLSLHRDMMRDFANQTGKRLDHSKFIKLTGLIRAENRDLFEEKQENTPSSLSQDYIDSLIRALQSVSLPNYSSYNQNSKVVTPPMIAVRLGNDIFIKGVVNSSITVQYRKPIMADGKYSTVGIQFAISEVDPYTANQVKKQGSFRGYVRGDIR